MFRPIPIERRYCRISGDSFGVLTIWRNDSVREAMTDSTWRYCEIAHETETERGRTLTSIPSAACANILMKDRGKLAA